MPILVSAIAASVAKLIKSNTGSEFLGRIMGFFLIATISVTIIGMVVGLAAKPGANLGAAGWLIFREKVAHRDLIRINLFTDKPATKN